MKYTRQQLNSMTNAELMKQLKRKKVSNASLQARVDEIKKPLESFKSKLPAGMVPGNVGELSKVHWGFFGSLRNIVVGPGVSINKVLTVSEEAAFALKSIQRVVFVRDGVAPNYTYSFLDPEVHTDANHASGLFLEIKDGSSSRSFVDDAIPMEHIGDHRSPTEMRRSYAFLPNSNIEFRFVNSHATRTYVVNLVLNGYRVRIPGQRELSSFSY